MRISDEEVLEFQSLYKERLGVDLSWEDARAKATSLVRMMHLTYMPMTLDEYQKYKNEDEYQYEPTRPENIQ